MPTTKPQEPTIPDLYDALAAFVTALASQLSLEMVNGISADLQMTVEGMEAHGNDTVATLAIGLIAALHLPQRGGTPDPH